MYSQIRISQNSFPIFNYIFPKSFMIFCQELQDPKRNYENQIWTWAPKDVIMKKTSWIWTQDLCLSGKYLVTGPLKQDIKCSRKSILVPLITTKDCQSCRSLTDLADLFPQLGSSHKQLCGNCIIYLALMVQCLHTDNWCRGPGFESLVRSLLFFNADILGRLGSNLVFIVPFGTSNVEFGTEVWLVPFGIMLSISQLDRSIFRI